MTKEKTYKEEDYKALIGPEGLFEPVLEDIRSWPIYRLGLIREKRSQSLDGFNFSATSDSFSN